MSPRPRPSGQGLFPLASLSSGALGGGGAAPSTLALRSDGESLVLVDAKGKVSVAGPTFTELLHYLGLGWSKRDEVEEDLLGAIQLKAHLRTQPRD